MKRRGLTLIETIVGVSVIAIAFYMLIAVLVNLAPRTARVETINKKIYLAQEKTEEYLARRFDQAVSLGPAAFPGSFGNYQYQVVVSYVATSELNTPVGGPTDFKNIKVKVWGGPVDAAGTVEVVSLITSYEVK